MRQILYNAISAYMMENSEPYRRSDLTQTRQYVSWLALDGNRVDRRVITPETHNIEWISEN
jgi:hypothetical protein